jgi:hypothetical protein
VAAALVEAVAAALALVAEPAVVARLRLLPQ